MTRPGSEHAAASAPAKVILLGEHAVNRGQEALATAVGLRVRCDVERLAEPVAVLVAGEVERRIPLDELERFAAGVDALRAAGDVAAVGRLAGDFLAPARYALAGLARRVALPGLRACWDSELPVGAGLGSGAAAAAALVAAAAELAGEPLAPPVVAELAARADVIAHGGVASGLDAGASAFGGVIRYAVDGGARPVGLGAPMTLVVAHTGVAADTASVNAGLRARLVEQPGLARHLVAIGALVGPAADAVERGDLDALGRAMLLDQLALARIGVSCPEIDLLVEHALAAGALGAKLSGSGGGGIVIALVDEARAAAVADALRPHAAELLVLDAGAEGVTTERRRAPA